LAFRVAQGCIFQAGLQAAVTYSVFSLLATGNVPHSAGWPRWTCHGPACPRWWHG